MYLFELLPEGYYEENATMIELQKILGTDTDEMQINIDKLINEIFLHTASDTLSRYELIFGIKANSNKPDEFRRDRLITKMMGQGTVTKQFVKNISEQYSNGKVEIEEDSKNYIVKVIFSGSIGIPPNFDDLKATLKEIVPAHLEIIYVIVYNTNENIKKYTHQQLKAYTHEQIRNNEMV